MPQKKHGRNTEHGKNTEEPRKKQVVKFDPAGENSMSAQHAILRLGTF
jgi:hypothetical protein